MSSIRDDADEHVAMAVISGRRRRGVDATSVADAGLRGASDEIHLTLALAQQRVIFTQDHDFLRLSSAGMRHVGIVFAAQRTSIGAIIGGLMLIYNVLSAEEMMDSIEFI